jgi:hypothetical protein
MVYCRLLSSFAIPARCRSPELIFATPLLLGIVERHLSNGKSGAARIHKDQSQLTRLSNSPEELGFGGVRTDSNHGLMYTSACPPLQ